MVLESAVLDRRCLQILGSLDGEDILSRTTRLLTDDYGFDMSWIAEPADGGALIRHTAGNRTDHVRGTLLATGLGLGGKVLESGRLAWVDDYLSSPDITHEYDAMVASEHLQHIIAAPMILGERNFGVLLAGYRDGGSCGGRSIEIVERVAQRCAEALLFAERVRAAAEAAVYEDRRRTALALHDTAEATLTSIAAHLRGAGSGDDVDDRLARRLRAIECQAEDATAGLRRSLHELLAAPVDLLPASELPVFDPVAEGTAPNEQRTYRGKSIAKREYDVLCRVAIGETNHEIAAAMNLSCNTIKTYLRNVMSKLGARNRVEAIVHARELGLL
jgi:DNA-binding NarL/FixJ family response regulator